MTKDERIAQLNDEIKSLRQPMSCGHAQANFVPGMIAFSEIDVVDTAKSTKPRCSVCELLKAERAAVIEECAAQSHALVDDETSDHPKSQWRYGYEQAVHDFVFTIRALPADRSALDAAIRKAEEAGYARGRGHQNHQNLVVS